MKVRNMFAVLTLAVAMFISIGVNAQTTPKTTKAPANTAAKTTGTKHTAKKKHHRRHKKAHKGGSTTTPKPAPAAKK